MVTAQIFDPRARLRSYELLAGAAAASKKTPETAAAGA
jgi:hypothetical protein